MTKRKGLCEKFCKYCYNGCLATAWGNSDLEGFIVCLDNNSDHCNHVVTEYHLACEHFRREEEV